MHKKNSYKKLKENLVFCIKFQKQ